MDIKKIKFECPHCCEEMDVDMIYLHVRKIFNSSLHRCSECNFSTNDAFHSDHHKSVTGHRYENNNGLNPLLEDVISATATMFINSVSKKDNNVSIVKNIKAKEIKNNEISREIVNRRESSASTSNGRRILDLEPKKKFFSNTIILINTMSFDYEKQNYNSKACEVLEISTDATLPKQKYNVPLPHYDKNKTVLCTKCKKEIHESYLARRKHVFIDHQGDILNSIKDTQSLKKTDILFAGFKTIRLCFPGQIVCTDFQCIECGLYYCSLSGVRYHVGVNHQRSILIECPFGECDFKTGSNCHAKDHIRLHMKGITSSSSKNDVSVKDLVSYVSTQNFIKFNNSCKSESQLTKNIAKHYFPINISYYDNFQKDFKDSLIEFKKSYLQPYVLNDLAFNSLSINESELFQSHNDIDMDSEEDCELIGKSTSRKKNVLNRKRKNENSYSDGSDVIFLKEVGTMQKKSVQTSEMSIDKLPASESMSSKHTPAETVTKINTTEQSKEDCKFSKFRKEIPAFVSVVRHFLQNNNDGISKKELVSTVNDNSSTIQVKGEIIENSLQNKSKDIRREDVYDSSNDRSHYSTPKSRYRDYNDKRNNGDSRNYYNDNKRFTSSSRHYDNSSGCRKSSYQKYNSHH